MNKRQLIDAIRHYPEDAQILVAVGSKLVYLDTKVGEASLVYRLGTSLAFAFSVADNPTDVVLEL